MATTHPTRRGPFWLRSIRRRPSSFVLVLVLSAVATLVSVLAPLLLRAVDQATLQSAVQRAGASAVTATADAPPAHFAAAIDAAGRIAAAAGDPARFAEPVVSIESDPTVTWPNRDGTLQRSLLIASQTGCARIRIVAGRCDADAGDVLLPATAKSGLQVGAPLSITIDTATRRTDSRLVVAGFYDPAFSPALAETTPGSEVGGIEQLSASDIVLSPGALSALGLEDTVSAVRRLRGPIDLQAVQPVSADIARARQATLTRTNATFGGAVQTDLDTVFATAQQQEAAAGVVMLVVTIDAVALAWFAEALVMQRIGRDRAREWGVGRLRGMRRGPWLARVFVEPVLAVVVGAVAGVAAAVPVALAITALAVHPSVPLEFGRAVIPEAALLVVLGSLVALATASIRGARLPLPELLRETAEPPQLSRAAIAAQTGVLLVTAAVLYALETSGTIGGPEIAVLAPGLVALLLGLLVLRAAILVAQVLARRPPRTLAGLVVARRLSRSPSSLSTALVVVIGVALAVYTADLALVSTQLERQRAVAAVGAATVLTVSAPEALSLVAAVDRADPSGRVAMAAEQLTPVNERGTSRVLAVDTSRLGAVAASAGGTPSAAALHRELAPAVGPSLELRGSTLHLDLQHVAETVTVDTVAVIHLQVTLQNSSGWHTVDLGSIADGTVSAAIPCTSGCRVVWIGTRDLVKMSSPYDVALTVTRLSTNTQPDTSLARWLDPARWRNRIGDQSNPERPAAARLSAGAGGGLAVDFSDAIGSETTSISTHDAPEPLPAELASNTAPSPYPGIPDSATGIGLDSLPRVLHVVGTETVLPRLLDDGALVDLGMMSLVDDPAASTAVKEVWMAPGTHPSVIAALAAEGVRVTGEQTLAAAVRADDAGAVPATAALSGTVGLAALLLTAVALIASRVIGIADRRRDWDSLADAGVPRWRLRRLLTLEVLVPNAVGALLGGAAGVVELALTAPHLPLLAGAGPTPPPDLTPPFLALLAVVAGGIAAIAGIAAVAARAEIRPATGGRG